MDFVFNFFFFANGTKMGCSQHGGFSTPVLPAAPNLQATEGSLDVASHTSQPPRPAQPPLPATTHQPPGGALWVGDTGPPCTIGGGLRSARWGNGAVV